MSKLIKPAIGLFGLLTVLTGVVYPLAVTGIAQWVFPEKATCSLILEDEQARGSALIGQAGGRSKVYYDRNLVGQERSGREHLGRKLQEQSHLPMY
jgi:potassium-transporting ATPase KdpC subunit